MNIHNRARDIVLALKGRWHGGNGTCFCPAHENTRTPALSITDGDNGKVVVHCFAGCDARDVYAALRGLGLIEGGGTYTPPDPVIAAKRRADDLAEAEKKAKRAFRLWTEAVPIKGTLAERYLRNRGITCDLPESLRFHPDCRHLSGKRFPAMIARVDGAETFAAHRTYLQADGSGKAQIDPPRAMLGACNGGAVRLSGDAGALAVAEGIETSLSLASGLLRAPATVWATLSTSGMRNLRLPPKPGKLIIASDGDPAGQAAAEVLASRAHAAGWSVRMLPAPTGRDWNDILQMPARKAVAA